MQKMQNKKIFKVLALSALGLLGLTACNEVVARPNDYSSSIIRVSGYDKEIYNDIMKVIYDNIKDGGVGSDVLNEVLYEYSISLLGPYDKFIEPTSLAADQITLKQAGAKDAPYETVNKFVKAHKAYWTLDDDGNRIDDDGNKVSETANASLSEVSRVQAKLETVNDRIAETMSSKITGGTYSDRSIYSEYYFLQQLKASFKDVRIPAEADCYKDLILPDHEPEDVFGRDGKVAYIHRDAIESDTEDGPHYVQKDVIPDIYRDLLTEQYLLDETYQTLGRSYARKVNVITFSANSNESRASDYLARALTEEINAKPTFTAHPDSIKFEDADNFITLDTFKKYSNAYIGVTKGDHRISEEEEALLTQFPNIFEKKDCKGLETGDYYYKGTSFGDLMTSWEKIDDNPFLTDTTVESDFTNGYAYPKETGLELKGRELVMKDLTMTGWFIKNGGLADLPSNIHDRLFSIGTANGFDEDEQDKNAADRWQRNSQNEWVYSKSPTENAYLARIKGQYYLKTDLNNAGTDSDDETAQMLKDFKDILHYDSSSKTYYIIQVLEACSPSKLSKTSTHSYKYTRADMESIVNEVTKVVQETDSYTTQATKHYLKEMGIIYHDQSVYEYFKSNYPELFD